MMNKTILWYDTTLVAPRSPQDNMHSYHDMVEQFGALSASGYSVSIQDHRFVRIQMRHSESDDSSAIKNELNVKLGDEVSLTGLVCTLVSQGRKPPNPETGYKGRKAKQFEVPDERLESWLLNAFEQKGVSVKPEDLVYSDAAYLAVSKPNGPQFKFPVRRVWLKGTVVDLDNLEDLMVKGIGKKRAYGAGVMYVE